MMTDESIMPFGKYKGVKLIDVPASYLVWCNDQDWCKGQLKAYITDNLEVIKMQLKKP